MKEIEVGKMYPRKEQLAERYCEVLIDIHDNYDCDQLAFLKTPGEICIFAEGPESSTV